MKYDLMIRSRAPTDQTILEKHKLILAALTKIPQPVGIAGQVPPKAPDPGGDIGCGVTISKLLGRGIRGRLYYCFRQQAFSDRAMNDDFFDMSFKPEKIDYQYFVMKVLPEYISAFSAYHAELGNAEFLHIDFDAARAAQVGDRRFGVYRVYPVSFFDSILCKRAFGLDPSQIVERLTGKIEHVQLLDDGVYIVASSKPLPQADEDALCWKTKEYMIGSSAR